VLRLAPALLIALLSLFTAAQADLPFSERFHLVAPEQVRLAGEAVTIQGVSAEDTFVPGLGWLSGSGAMAPVRRGSLVYVDRANLERLGLEPHPVAELPAVQDLDEITPVDPLAARVRFGGDSEIRVVIDLPQLPHAGDLLGLEQEGQLAEGEALLLDLPRLMLPSSQPDPYHGIDVGFVSNALGTRLELRGPASSYEVFTLEGPTRLVIDVVPLRRERIRSETRTLMEGVVYRKFGAPTPSGQSLVHLLEIAPGAGEFRVVGTSEVARTLSELASGAFAAINAGYFDTSTFKTIGLLRVDYGLQSLPSRNRASVGFGIAGPVMTRVKAGVDVRVGGRLYRREASAGGPGTGERGLEVHTIGGARAGSARLGALVSQDGRIIANRVGPVTVPENGFVLVYPPEDRELALIEPGAPASIEVDFEPDFFQGVRYAVEAGPLLIQDGVPAFQPETEEFSRGQRILDAYTQQAAIGIKRDGTVLFLVADDMRAEDLIPLFMSLGAEQAMRLDSGSSATLLADGKVLNRANERRIVSAIVFLPDS
jgi:hypothetical protein